MFNKKTIDHRDIAIEYIRNLDRVEYGRTLKVIEILRDADKKVSDIERRGDDDIDKEFEDLEKGGK